MNTCAVVKVRLLPQTIRPVPRRSPDKTSKTFPLPALGGVGYIPGVFQRFLRHV